MQDEQSTNSDDSSGKISSIFHTPVLATVIITPPPPHPVIFDHPDFEKWQIVQDVVPDRLQDLVVTVIDKDIQKLVPRYDRCLNSHSNCVCNSSLMKVPACCHKYIFFKFLTCFLYPTGSYFPDTLHTCCFNSKCNFLVSESAMEYSSNLFYCLLSWLFFFSWLAVFDYAGGHAAWSTEILGCYKLWNSLLC